MGISQKTGISYVDNGVIAGGSTNQVLAKASDADYDLKWVTGGGGGASPLTTKGDLYGYSSADARIPVGTDGQVLTADSTQVLGVKWATASGSGTVTTTGSPASGNLTVFSGGTSITNGDLTGDVTTSGTLATTIGNAKVTLAKIANASANRRLLGSGASGSGSSYAEITLGTGLSMSGTTLNASGGSGISIGLSNMLTATL